MRKIIFLFLICFFCSGAWAVSCWKCGSETSSDFTCDCSSNGFTHWFICYPCNASTSVYFSSLLCSACDRYYCSVCGHKCLACPNTSDCSSWVCVSCGGTFCATHDKHYCYAGVYDCGVEYKICGNYTTENPPDPPINTCIWGNCGVCDARYCMQHTTHTCSTDPTDPDPEPDDPEPDEPEPDEPEPDEPEPDEPEPDEPEPDEPEPDEPEPDEPEPDEPEPPEDQPSNPSPSDGACPKTEVCNVLGCSHCKFWACVSHNSSLYSAHFKCCSKCNENYTACQSHSCGSDPTDDQQSLDGLKVGVESGSSFDKLKKKIYPGFKGQTDFVYTRPVITITGNNYFPPWVTEYIRLGFEGIYNLANWEKLSPIASFVRSLSKLVMTIVFILACIRYIKKG